MISYTLLNILYFMVFLPMERREDTIFFEEQITNKKIYKLCVFCVSMVRINH